MTDSYPKVSVENFAGAIEGVTSGIKAITTDHGLIHAGKGYTASHVWAGVANGGTAGIYLTTPATGYLHLKRYEVWTSKASARFDLVENPAMPAGGTTLVTYNRRRIAPVTASGVTVKHQDGTAAAWTGGTVVETWEFGGGGEGKSSSADSRSLDVEFVLAPSETYYVSMINDSGETAKMGMWLFWYEETNG